jgi:CBS domain-containing protein
MRGQVATVRREDRLDRAAALLRDQDCGCVVVVDPEGRAVGVVTDRDICLTTLRTAKALNALTVASAMSAKLFHCRADETIAEAEDRMSLHQVRRLPVLDHAGHVLGILALDDIAREACREEGLIAPPVSCAAVGRTLGQIARPHLVASAGS